MDDPVLLFCDSCKELILVFTFRSYI